MTLLSLSRAKLRGGDRADLKCLHLGEAPVQGKWKRHSWQGQRPHQNIPRRAALSDHTWPHKGTVLGSF